MICILLESRDSPAGGKSGSSISSSDSVPESWSSPACVRKQGIITSTWWKHTHQSAMFKPAKNGLPSRKYPVNWIKTCIGIRKKVPTSYQDTLKTNGIDVDREKGNRNRHSFVPGRRGSHFSPSRDLQRGYTSKLIPWGWLHYIHTHTHTHTFSIKLFSLSECVRSLWVRNFSMLDDLATSTEFIRRTILANTRRVSSTAFARPSSNAIEKS